jgi:hypothetical protein
MIPRARYSAIYRYDIAYPVTLGTLDSGRKSTGIASTPATFQIGRTTVPVDDSTTIGLYDAPRTIVNSDRLRSALGLEVAHGALHRWLRTDGHPAKLITVATAFPRATTALMNTLEILLRLPPARLPDPVTSNLLKKARFRPILRR